MAGSDIEYELVIGLEVHAQLLTKSKLFCGDSVAYGAAPNSQVSPVTLAHPGSLPVMNKAAIVGAIRMGLACGCEIERNNYFAHKNYFYPDLPKGYQISQPLPHHYADPVRSRFQSDQCLLDCNQYRCCRRKYHGYFFLHLPPGVSG